MARQDVNLTTVTKAIADPTRAAMLLRLMDGQAHSAGALAAAVGSSASAATAHLNHLRQAGLIDVQADGRRRLHRLASSSVAQAIEALAEISPLLPEPGTHRLPREGIDAKLRYARTCYSHLGGMVAVRVSEMLQRDGCIELSETRSQLNTFDHMFFANLEITALTTGPGPALRFCLDWSERLPHLSGRLGSQILTAMLAHEWVRRSPRDRSLNVTTLGRKLLTDCDALP